ncbi:hypothetical protein ABZ805_13560 [Saccharopolyspora sp. NPDC047091]|uniref:hypothetical protein n=1 Tax=Saccharopolyspora sp. NPDC047091 TaxID=3155924 RepID=UPI0033C2F55F
MADTDTTALVPGQSISRDNGERLGRSAAGHLVQLRRRVAEPGFVVTSGSTRGDAVLTAEWAHANAAFDRMMRED